MDRSSFPHGVHLRGVPLIYTTNLVNQMMPDFEGFEECINFGPAQVWGVGNGNSLGDIYWQYQVTTADLEPSLAPFHQL